ncbi:MAG: hypothetical protein ACOYMQ_18985 [Pseudanabaena sp.]
MATPHRTKQVNLRFPLPLLSQIKTQADAKQQAIADWILTVISREFEPEPIPEKLPEPAPFILHPDILTYVENCLAPLHAQISEMKMQLGESKA